MLPVVRLKRCDNNQTYTTTYMKKHPKFVYVYQHAGYVCCKLNANICLKGKVDTSIFVGSKLRSAEYRKKEMHDVIGVNF